MAPRIILVDDEPPLLTLLGRMLTKAGYDVLSFASAEDTLAATGGGFESVELLIADQQLPGKSGAELAVELGERWPTMKALICSGLPVDLQDLPAGMLDRVGSLQKPFSPDQLLDAVSAALAKTSPSI